MSTYRPQPMGENNEAYITRLADLFAEIDINGDHELSWEEFTAYVIKMGILPVDTSESTMKKVEWEFIRKSLFFTSPI